MELIKYNAQNKIKSDTCGLLLEVINREDFPFGIVLSENIKSTKPHYHKVAQKCYWVLEGSVKVLIENVKSGIKKKVTLEKGDLITFEPFEKHSVINASEKNKGSCED